MDDELDLEPDGVIARAVLDSPTFLAVSRQLANAKADRRSTTRPIEVLQIDDFDAGGGLKYLRDGIAVLVVTADRELLQALQGSIADRDLDEVDSVIDRIKDSFETLNASHYAPISSSAHIADVYVTSRPIAENILIEEGASYVDVYPYLGGDVDPERAISVDYASPPSGDIYAVLLLIAPSLSETELAALDSIPTRAEAMIGEGVVAVLPAAWAVARGAYAAYIVGKYLYKEYKQTKAWRAARGVTRSMIDSPVRADEIPTGASVSELLEARAEVFRARLADGD